MNVSYPLRTLTAAAACAVIGAFEVSAQTASEAVFVPASEFAAHGPLGVWRFPEGSCTGPLGHLLSPLTLHETRLTFSTIGCEFQAYEQIGKVWRITAACAPSDSGSIAKFVFAPLTDETLIMSLLSARTTDTYMLDYCKGPVAK